MQFSVAAVLAFAASALAQTPNFDPITKPGQSETVAAGSSFQINWQPSTQYTGPVTIALLGGATPSTLDVVSTIAKSVDNAAGTFAWPVDASLGSLATYGIRISLDSDPSIFQYSFPFAIKASQAASSSAVVSTSAAVTTSAVASSAVVSSAPVTTVTAGTVTTLTTVCTTSSTVVIPQSTIKGNSTVPTSQSPSVSLVPTRTPSTIAVSGAKSVAVGSFTLFGAVAVALLAL